MQPREEPPNLEARLLVWAEILDGAVAEVKRTVSEIRRQSRYEGLPLENVITPPDMEDP